MAILPETPRGFWDDFAPAFSRPTFRRSWRCRGRRSSPPGVAPVTNLPRAARSLADGPLPVIAASSRRPDGRRSSRPTPRPVASSPSRRRGRPGWRRHGLLPPGRPRLRQGPASQPGPILARIHLLALRPQVGRARGARPLPVRRPPVGPAGTLRPVSRAGRRPPREASPPHAGPVGDPAAAADAPMAPGVGSSPWAIRPTGRANWPGPAILIAAARRW